MLTGIPLNGKTFFEIRSAVWQPPKPEEATTPVFLLLRSPCGLE